MQNSLKNVVESSKSIVILLPTNPTFDQVASATSLYLALGQEEGKEVNVYSPSPMIVEFNRLIGVNKVKNEIGNKNLAISFKDYNPQGIEKVSWDIDNGVFKLTIVPKANVVAPTQDQVIISYAGVAADTVILIGGNGEADFPVIKTDDLKEVNLVHIGISEVRVEGRTLSSLATASSSISEVMANLIKTSNYQISADVATDLLMGVEEATKGFMDGATADTFGLISELMKLGGKRLNQGQVVQSDFPEGAIPGMPSNVPTSWTEPKIFKGTSVS